MSNIKKTRERSIQQKFYIFGPSQPVPREGPMSSLRGKVSSSGDYRKVMLMSHKCNVLLFLLFPLLEGTYKNTSSSFDKTYLKHFIPQTQTHSRSVFQECRFLSNSYPTSYPIILIKPQGSFSKLTTTFQVARFNYVKQMLKC